MWDKSSNLRAYTNIEQLTNYKNAVELNNYRQHLLKKSQEQANYIKSYFNHKIKVFEACAGNSRLLYKLYLNSALEEAEGVEISTSRFDFAQDWKNEFPGANVVNVCANIIEYQAKKEYYDIAVCITGAFGYFYPIDNSYPEKLLNKLYDLIRVDGYILLELYQHSKDIEFCRMGKNNEINRWVELPKSDPFRFYLSKYIFYEKENCLDCREIFIRRDGYIDDTKNEVLKIYSMDEINKMLIKSGFEIKDIHGEWNKEKYDNRSEKLIIMAKKIGR